MMTRRGYDAKRTRKRAAGAEIGSAPLIRSLWKISLRTTAEAEDAVSDLFEQSFAQRATSYTAAATNLTTVAVYVRLSPARLRAGLQALRSGLVRIQRCGLNPGRARLTVRRLPSQEWVESWKRHFRPLAIGDALLIKPSWNKRRPRRTQALVVLDPGLSFGTGQHPTTEFCLRQIAAAAGPTTFPRTKQSTAITADRRPCSLLDLGTGSGILAIAAAKLGFAPVHALDCDPQAVRVARANARANCVQDKLRISHADLTCLPRRRARAYDFVCANLLGGLLIAERDRIVARVRSGGRLVLAGILWREFDLVRAAYESAGLRLVASRTEKEWRSGMFMKDLAGEGRTRFPTR